MNPGKSKQPQRILPTTHAVNRERIIHMAVLYVIWGSTFLATRLAVRGGFPPFLMGAGRVLIAGLALLLWATYQKQKISISLRDFAILSLSGVLLWVTGNGLVLWAEQYVASGYAALLFGSLPIWVALIDVIVGKKKPNVWLILSLMVGFAGLTVLSVPELTGASKIRGVTVILLLIAPISWAVGTIIQRGNSVTLSSLVSSGYQQIFGGVGFLIAALLFHEQFITSPTETAWFAWAYLVIFGSLLAYTSFVQALRLLPTNIVMTYAYVNPVVAVFLGWLVLSEKVTPWTIAGMVCIVVSVIGVLRNNKSKGV